MEIHARSANLYVGDKVYKVKLPMDTIDRTMTALLISIWRKEYQDCRNDQPMSMEEIKDYIRPRLQKSINRPRSEMARLKIILDHSPETIEKVVECFAYYIRELNTCLEAEYNAERRYIFAEHRPDAGEIDVFTFEQSQFLNSESARKIKARWLGNIEGALLDINPMPAKVKKKRISKRGPRKRLAKTRRTLDTAAAGTKTVKKEITAPNSEKTQVPSRSTDKQGKKTLFGRLEEMRLNFVSSAAKALKALRRGK